MYNKFKATCKNGKLHYISPKCYSEFLKNFEEKEMIVTIERFFPKRTLPQNSLLHALLSDAVRELRGLGIGCIMNDIEQPWDEELLKQYFRLKFCKSKKTSKCDTKELADAITNFIIYVNELGGQLSVSPKYNHVFEDMNQ